MNTHVTGRRQPAVLAIAVAIALLCGGMALAIAGVIIGALFLPGVVLLALGILACAAAGVLRLMRPQADDGTVARRV